MSLPTSSRNPPAFVLVHGAWNGGWCWSRVAPLLRQAGHAVFTPTCTGMGERSHLLNNEIGPSTFIQDVINQIVWEDLHEVILVGHSFAGVIISGVADRIPERLKHLVYLDAFILESGVSTMDTLSEENQDRLKAAVDEAGGTVPVLPPPRPKSLNIIEPDDVAFVLDRLTPQPFRSYVEAVTLSNPHGNGIPAHYLHCTEPAFAAVAESDAWAQENTDWIRLPLAASHCAMVTAPTLLANTLLHIASEAE
ncbi:alpha/beta fold hydrolase [Allopusillimonas soli]|uniref:Alpha/beta fold hydrolase n=1 Tax=Allopusillimonas soli TaxID=659016 RepID=A0A853FAA5_9BURK|nr:alpha/beta fold hydrolase [Allopusillimonas soli]NYT36552.1 alpha/beta fold hydrolase [Allopusillimonas soli]TEA75046.1 alpha/beta fold hydrolase [Allopusillimonas soli]